MPFDRPDVDFIYESAIEPAVARAGLQPRVVNRIIHNNDIDDQIHSEIKECTLCIADLTFERPSVYFEAGLALGLGKELIFTVERSHLSPLDRTQPKVHFDLLMKNIIPWDKSSTQVFESALERRLSHVLKSVVENKKESTQSKQAELEFSKRPISEQLRSLKSAASIQLWEQNFFNPDDEVDPQNLRKALDSFDHYVRLTVTDGTSLKQSWLSVERYNIWKSQDRRFVFQDVIISLRRLNRDSLARKFNWHALADTVLIKSLEMDIVKFNMDPQEPYASVRKRLNGIHCISWISAAKSESQVQSEIYELTQKAESEARRYFH